MRGLSIPAVVPAGWQIVPALDIVGAQLLSMRTLSGLVATFSIETYDSDDVADGMPMGPGRYRHAGFNDRWDQMTKDEQCSGLRNKRSVWTIATQPYSEAHFATFPKKLVEPCVLASTRPGDLVLDPFAGSGTTLAVAQQLGRRSVGIELNPAYCTLAEDRCRQEALQL